MARARQLLSTLVIQELDEPKKIGQYSQMRNGRRVQAVRYAHAGDVYEVVDGKWFKKEGNEWKAATPPVKETRFSPGIEQFLDGVLGPESTLPEEAVQDFLNWSGGWGPDETSDNDVAFWLSDNGERFGLANMDPDQFRASWKAAMNKTESLVAQLVHENTTRRIDTGLTGPVNGAILSSVMGQLSDGKWENTPQMSKYWRNADIVDEGGRLFIDVTDGWDSGFRGKDEKWIKTWFAGKIKEIVYDEMGGVQWNRSDTSEVSYLSRSGQPVTVSNAYQAYEILKGRNLRNRYATPAPAVPPAV